MGHESQNLPFKFLDNMCKNVAITIPSHSSNNRFSIARQKHFPSLQHCPTLQSPLQLVCGSLGVTPETPEYVLIARLKCINASTYIIQNSSTVYRIMKVGDFLPQISHQSHQIF